MALLKWISTGLFCAVAGAALVMALSRPQNPHPRPAFPDPVPPLAQKPPESLPPALGATDPDGYRLVWSNEFDKPLDPADWTFEQGFVRNQELQWYQPENASTHDGHLFIEARRESKPNPRYVAPPSDPALAPSTQPWQNRPQIEFTSASLTTRGKHQWLYGRFEIRAKIDTRPGSWPAFWILGSQGQWPANGEVDIMEYYRGTLLANVAWAGTPSPTWNTGSRPLASLGPTWADRFHLWRMDWDATSIKLFVDGELVNSQDLAQTTNAPSARGRGGRGGRGRQQAPENPFRAPAYLILNQAIGGQQGGDPTGTAFPVRFEVDFVRVWQKPEPPPTSAPQTAPSPPRTP